MTVAEPSLVHRAGRPGRGGRLSAALLAAAALLLMPSTAAAASQTHDLEKKQRIVESGGKTRVHLSGTLTFYSAGDPNYPNGYFANFWIHNGTAKSPSVYFKYHRESGAVHTTRTWGNPNGPGESLRHEAWLGGKREGQAKVTDRIRFITVVLAAGNLTSICHYPNKFVLREDKEYETTVQCGPANPAPPTTGSERILIDPNPAPATPAPPPPPPVVLPGPAPVAPAKPRRGCRPTERPIVAKLRVQRRKGRAVPRIRSVTFWTRPLRGGKATAAARTRRPVGRKALRKAGRLKFAGGKPFRVRLSNGFLPGTRIRVYARVRYRWRGESKVHRRTTRRVVRICA